MDLAWALEMEDRLFQEETLKRNRLMREPPVTIVKELAGTAITTIIYNCPNMKNHNRRLDANNRNIQTVQ